MLAPSLPCDAHTIIAVRCSRHRRRRLVQLDGLPGSGKSYACGRLAAECGYALIELDEITQQASPSPLAAPRRLSLTFSIVTTGSLSHH